MLQSRLEDHMLATVHILAGVSIAAYAKKETDRPDSLLTKSPTTSAMLWLGFGLLATVSHGMDAIMHFEPGTLNLNYLRFGSTGFIMASVDNLTGFLLMFYWIRKLEMPLVPTGCLVFCSWSPDVFQYLAVVQIWVGPMADWYQYFHTDVLHWWKPILQPVPGAMAMGITITILATLGLWRYLYSLMPPRSRYKFPLVSIPSRNFS